MDPNTNLAEQLHLAHEILRKTDLGEDIGDEMATSLAELVQSLDGWITRGGFLPARWQPKA